MKIFSQVTLLLLVIAISLLHQNLFCLCYVFSIISHMRYSLIDIFPLLLTCTVLHVTHYWFDSITVIGATSILLLRFCCPAVLYILVVYNNTDIPISRQRSDVEKANQGHGETYCSFEKTPLTLTLMFVFPSLAL